MNSGMPGAEEVLGKTPVLLIDDQVLVAQVVRRMLAADSSLVFHYEQDPLQALELVARLKPTVILQDLDMPGVDGLDLLKSFRDNPLTQAISVIVLSAREDSATKNAAFEAGADDFIVKMPSRTELLARVRRHSQVCVQELQRVQEIRTLKENLATLVEQNAALIHRNDELTRSNADLEQFACVAAHDLQEPLRSVKGGIQVFERKYRGKLDQNAEELTGMIVDGSSRMQALITDLLTYSRAGQAENLETVDTRAALQQVLASLTSAIRDSEAEIAFEDLPALRFLSGQFNHLLQNLVGNAIKYRGTARPKIHVSAVRQRDAWVFSVADNGIGFDPQYTDKIFGIFQRLHGREKYAGTGIGLALVKKLVERRGGWIWVDSVPEHGSTFYFSVPDEDGEWQISSEHTGRAQVNV